MTAAIAPSPSIRRQRRAGNAGTGTSNFCRNGTQQFHYPKAFPRRLYLVHARNTGDKPCPWHRCLVVPSHRRSGAKDEFLRKWCAAIKLPRGTRAVREKENPSSDNTDNSK